MLARAGAKAAEVAASLGGRVQAVARRPGARIKLSKYGGFAVFTLLIGGALLAVWLIVTADTAIMEEPAGPDFYAPEIDALSTGMHVRHGHHRRHHRGHAPRGRLEHGVASSVWGKVVGTPPFHDQHTARDEARRQWAAVTAKHGAVAVVWKVPVGCDFSGFFTEVLGLLPAIVDDVGGDFFLDVGHCNDAMLAALSDSERDVLRALQAKSVNILARLAARGTPYVLIQHKLPRNELTVPMGNVLVHVARAMTEAAVVDSWEVAQMRTVDEVWVPTSWHTGVFSLGGIPAKKLFVLPEAIDLDFFTSSQRRPLVHSTTKQVDLPHSESRKTGLHRHRRGTRGGAGGDEFRFLAVAKWEHRKGFDVLLRAYWAEFASDAQAVVLRLRTYKPAWEPGPDDLNAQFAAIAQQFAHLPLSRLPRVEWVRDDLTRAELRHLYDDSDAFVLPTRGEGWGLPIVEAMSMGLPTIATNFSGPTAYLNERTGYPVKYSLNPDGTAEPDIADLRRQMRRVFQDRERAAEVGRVGQAFIKDHYSAEAVAATAVSRLATLALAKAPKELNALAAVGEINPPAGLHKETLGKNKDLATALFPRPVINIKM